MAEAPIVITLLADVIRWNIVQELKKTDLKVKEISLKLGKPMNLVSYHLKLLRDAEIVISRKSEADGRDFYYSLSIKKLRSLYKDSFIIFDFKDEQKE